MIGKDLNRKGRALGVMVPGAETMDDGKEFSIIDVMISFCEGEQLGEVRTGVPVSIGVGFQEDTSEGMLDSVSGNGEGTREVREVKDGLGEEELLETFEGGLTSGDPGPGISKSPILGQVSQYYSNITTSYSTAVTHYHS